MPADWERGEGTADDGRRTTDDERLQNCKIYITRRRSCCQGSGPGDVRRACSCCAVLRCAALCCACACACLDGALGKSSPPIHVAESVPSITPLRSERRDFRRLLCSTLVIWETFAHSAIRFLEPGRLQPACIGDFLRFWTSPRLSSLSWEPG